ncbi:phospholipase A2 [Actinoplanes sp. NPDC051346]|uniref:phospholipase A2 n=1 Tax=Actinoplanes sp. NPDC051346 TaxID=3155048 RepID=UPI003445B618
MSRHRRNGSAPGGRRWATLAAALVVAAGLVQTTDLPAPAAAAVPAGGMAAADVNTMFSGYGDAGNHWTGGDNTASVELPDGRVAWLFSDTFLGTVNPDGSRPAGTPMVNNTIVVQEGASLVDTRHGGTAAAPTALVVPGQPGEYYWVADGVVEGGTLKVLYNRHRRSGTGNLDFVLTGTALATFTLPGLHLDSVVDLPLSDKVAWGSEVVSDGGYTYVYGSENAPAGMRFGKVARVGADGLDGAWQFWTGSAWSATESDAGRLLSGVGTSYAVQRVGAEYVLVTQENNLLFDGQYVAYTASAPTGPFSGPVQLFGAPEQLPGTSIITYDARLHPELARSGKLLVSYNVNSLRDADNLADARLYRPRFVEVDWPRPRLDPATLPAAPQGFTATVDSAGTAQLSWQPVAGAARYRVHQRDLTAGQTHFARLSSTPTGTSTEVAMLRDGHSYQFRVTAENAVGEGPASATVQVTPQIGPPPAPTGLTATADQGGRVTVRWSPVSSAWNYEVFRRDVTAGETSFTFLTRPAGSETSHQTVDLEHNHEYEFYVTAHHGGGASPASATVRATATYAPPGAPLGLAAATKSDGTIGLSWAAPGPDVWYRVYQRDVTAGETQFTRLSLPVAQGTAMTAGLLAHNHEYEFKVSATNRGGEGPASAVARARAVYPVPAAPSGLTATAGSGQAVLKWTASSTPNVWYQVHQRNVTTGEPQFTQLPLPVTECCAMTAGYLTNGQTYEFKVTTTSQGGESAATSTIQVTPRVPLPGAVTGLTATADADGTIGLRWTAPPGDGLWYDIHVRDVTKGEAGFTKLPLPVTTCCTFTAGLLVHNHVYQFKVAATNGAGAGPLSAAVQETSTYARPAAPKNLRGTAVGNGSVTLDWDAPGPHLQYWIYWRNVTTGEANFVKGVFPTEHTTANIGMLAHGHVYEFKVTAQNQGGEGVATTPIRVTSLGGVPQPPGGLTATAGNGQAVLRWTASPTANVTYDVYQRNESAGGSWQKLPISVQGTSMTAGLLTNGNTYQFKVAARNPSGSSDTTNLASARPMPPPPAAPTGLTATPGDGRVALRWSGVSDVHYWVELRSRGGAWQRLRYPVTTCCAFDVTLLENAVTYEFRVLANNITGDSGFSAIASARPMPPFPGAPSGLTATPGDRSVSLRWTGSGTPNVRYWVYQRGVTTGGAWQRLPMPWDLCCSFNAGVLANGHTYEFKVSAFNVAGESATTNVATAKPMPPAPYAPSGLSITTWLAQGAAYNVVTLSWQAQDRDEWFTIEGRNASRGGSWREWFRSSPGNSTMEQFEDLYGNDRYEFRVTATNLSGSATSHMISAVPKPPKLQVYHQLTGMSAESFEAWNAARNNPGAYWEYNFNFDQDGCSVPQWGQRYLEYSNTFFNVPCRRHDFGYRNHKLPQGFPVTYFMGNKNFIDGVFHWDMQNACRSDPRDPQLCRDIAWFFYQGVNKTGEGDAAWRSWE